MQVVLYLNRKLSDPKRIFLTSRHKLAQPTAELVESDMQVGAVMQLLESRGFATPFQPGAQIYGKRQDGSTLPTEIPSEEPIQALEDRIAELEASVCSLCMHVFSVATECDDTSALKWPCGCRHIL